MKVSSPYFCVATTTYNMSQTIYRTYKSILAQTYKNFYWLVIDNGSEDDTENVIKGCINEEKIKIQYIRISHGIRMVAVNTMLDYIQGDLCVEIHADDTLTADALEIFANEWNKIALEKRAYIWTMASHCINEAGEIVGKAFPPNINEKPSKSWRYQFHTTGEKHYAMNTTVVKTGRVNMNFFSNVTYVAESCLWMQFQRDYQMWFISKATRVYRDDNPNRATETIISKKTREAYYQSSLFLINTFFRFDKKPFRNFIQHVIICFHNGQEAGRSLHDVYIDLLPNMARGLLIVIWPLLKIRSRIKGN